MTRGNAFYNAVIGTSGLVVSVLALTLSTALLLGPRQEPDLNAIRKSNIESCQLAGQREGYIVSKQGIGVEMKISGIKNYREKLMSSSLVIKQCEGMVLNTFCMGECLDSKNSKYQGIIMDLQYKEPVLK
ncbi:hypothetical protein P5704_025785 (plasmid) [Pseudomonas sp. FeN3W]|nr:hypothetical protein P5704_025785 [Pseudomonas sp. FeN3W]